MTRSRSPISPKKSGSSATRCASSPRRASARASRRWSAATVQPPDLLAELFGLGLMGIEIPEAYGGAGASFFMAILAIEEIARVDPALAIPGRRAEHARREA